MGVDDRAIITLMRSRWARGGTWRHRLCSCACHCTIHCTLLVAVHCALTLYCGTRECTQMGVFAEYYPTAITDDTHTNQLRIHEADTLFRAWHRQNVSGCMWPTRSLRLQASFATGDSAVSLAIAIITVKRPGEYLKQTSARMWSEWSAYVRHK